MSILRKICLHFGWIQEYPHLEIGSIWVRKNGWYRHKFYYRVEDVSETQVRVQLLSETIFPGNEQPPPSPPTNVERYFFHKMFDPKEPAEIQPTQPWPRS